MAKIKEVLSSEVHWQVAGWNTKDQANIRIRQLLGDEASMFAPVFVTHGGYYWSDAEPYGWAMLSDASEADKALVFETIDELCRRTIARFPAQKGRIERIFSWPNDDFVFWRRDADGLRVLVTGWGFANYNRARGGSIVEAPDESNIREVSLAFTVDGIRQARRRFEIMQGVNWNRMDTDADGIFVLGRLTPGEEVCVRDIATGREFIETIGDDTTMLDLDVTEYIDVIINAVCDGAPLDRETAEIGYGHRSDSFAIESGRAARRLPWLDGQLCTVSVRGQKQTRQLVKDAVNEFDFDFTVANMKLTVHVSGDSNPISGEPIDIMYAGAPRRGVSGADGSFVTAIEQRVDAAVVAITVRDQTREVPFADGDTFVEFTFDTPPAEIFEATVRTIDLDGNPVPNYPITVDTGGGPNEYLTDYKACAAVGTVKSGKTMTVADATDARIRKVFELDRFNALYDFVLPYHGEPTAGDCLLRVIEADGKPSRRTTVILSQGETRVMAHLDDKGEMCFESADFTFGSPMKVSMFSQRRTFPELSFTLDKDEKEYELKEVDGPTPWWKIAGEIVLALAIVFGLFSLYYIWGAMFIYLTNIFA